MVAYQYERGSNPVGKATQAGNLQEKETEITVSVGTEVIKKWVIWDMETTILSSLIILIWLAKVSRVMQNVGGDVEVGEPHSSRWITAAFLEGNDLV